MRAINVASMPIEFQQHLLKKFPESWREKLKAYTNEELFYFWKLCLLKPKHALDEYGNAVFTKDMFFLSLKAKFFRYMEGKERSPINGGIWLKLSHKFKSQYDSLVEEYMEEEYTKTMEEKEKLIKALNSELVEASLPNLIETINSKKLA